MAYRCQSCNRLCGVENEDPTIDGLDVEVHDEDDAHVSGTLQVALTSACCADEVANASIDFEEDVTVQHAADCDPEDRDYDVEEVFCEADDWFEGNGSRGRHFYGANISVRVTCKSCDAQAEHDFEKVGEQGSAFDTY